MDQDADGAVVALYRTHYQSLVRLATLLVQDIEVAEELVQDSFVAMHSVWRRLGDSDRALSYLYQAVVTLSRTVLRRRTVVGKIATELGPGVAAVDPVAVTELEHCAVVSALQALIPRQREVLVLQYYSDLTEAETASVMRISERALRRYTAQAMSSVRAELRGTDR
jgi:RNA polymerase sigma factor (sigma-70 family)